MKKERRNKNNGFSLIEALVMLFVFSVITMTFYSVFGVGSRYIIDSKNRLGAVALANERMEVIRNMQYESIGTVNGIPAGSLLQDEDVIANTRQYHVRTLVKFDDDPLDGVFPADLVPNDYKRVKVTVSWPTSGQMREVSLVSRFVPPGLEVSSGDGVLSINIIDGTGAGVPQANVHIVNNDVSPTVDINIETDDSGNVMFPGAEESIQTYKITVSKSGYETVTTVSPAEVTYNAIDLNASVVAGLLNIKTIVQDRVSDLDIKAVDQVGGPVTDIDLRVTGGRILGTDMSTPPENEYKIDENTSVGSSGNKSYENIGPGQFTLSNFGSKSGYTFIKAEPASPFSLFPGEEKEVKLRFVKDDENALVVTVLKDSDNLPLAEADVHLTNVSGFDQTVRTTDDGIVIFPEDGGAMVSGDYALEVSASGFQTSSSSVSIDSAESREVKMVIEE